jgi:hypothetical protein
LHSGAFPISEWDTFIDMVFFYNPFVKDNPNPSLFFLVVKPGSNTV